MFVVSQLDLQNTLPIQQGIIKHLTVKLYPQLLMLFIVETDCESSYVNLFTVFFSRQLKYYKHMTSKCNDHTTCI